MAEPEGTRKNGFHLPTRDARLEAREKEIFHECETQRYSIVEPRMRKPRRDCPGAIEPSETIQKYPPTPTNPPATVPTH